MPQIIKRTVSRPSGASITRKAPAASATSATMPKNIREFLAKQKNAQPWSFYDKRYLGAAAFPGDAGVFNFAQMQERTPFFAVRTTGNAGWAYTSNSDVNKFDKDFIAYSIGVGVSCDPDAPGPVLGGECTAQVFAQQIVECSSFIINLGSEPLFVAPVADLPFGGGVNYAARVRTQAAGANSDSGGASNGVPDGRARRYLRQPISFKQGASFSIWLELERVLALPRVQGLTPLAGNINAVITVELEGIRGKPLLEGVSMNPAGLEQYNRQQS